MSGRGEGRGGSCGGGAIRTSRREWGRSRGRGGLLRLGLGLARHAHGPWRRLRMVLPVSHWEGVRVVRGRRVVLLLLLCLLLLLLLLRWPLLLRGDRGVVAANGGGGLEEGGGASRPPASSSSSANSSRRGGGGGCGSGAILRLALAAGLRTYGRRHRIGGGERERGRQRKRSGEGKGRGVGELSEWID